jgi:alanine dehydrogenase
MTRLLTRDDVAAVLTPADCLEAVEDAFRGYGEARAAAPKSVGFHAPGGTFHIKAAIADVFATKINANFPENPTRHQLPTIQGVIVVMDCERGTTLAILDSALITALRTAAATAVAAKYLARTNAKTLAVIGCGTQGRATVEALRVVRPIEDVVAYDIDAACADRFARDVANVRTVASIDDAVRDADIVVTCTPARAAILDVHHLHPGLFIAAVGADNPEKQELTPALLARTTIVADILDQAATMGDLHHALAGGALRREDVHGELADVICGRVPGRTSDAETFVFDSTGTALQDVAVASIAVRRAIERGVGMEIDFSGVRRVEAAALGRR